MIDDQGGQLVNIAIVDEQAREPVRLSLRSHILESLSR